MSVVRSQVSANVLFRRAYHLQEWPWILAYVITISACFGSGVPSLEASDPTPLCDLKRVPNCCLAFSSGSDAIALGGHDDGGALITMVDTGTWKEVAKMPFAGRSVNAVEFSPDSPLLFMAVGAEVVVLNLREKRVQTRLLRHTGTVFDIAVSGPTQNVATAGNDGRICIWDRKKLEHITEVNSEGTAIYSLAFDSTGVELAAAGRDLLRVWHRLEKKSFTDVKIETSPFCVRFSGEGNRVIAVSGTGEIIGSNRAKLNDRPETYDVGSFVEDCDCIAGTSVLVIGVGRDLALFDAAKSKILKRFAAFDSRLRIVRCDPVAMRVAAVSWDGQLKVWDVSELMKDLELPLRK